MYIKLTRFDNTPIWINASFVVTVEPRKQSVGSIVVPIGDGLDYEVRESPEQVLSMLDGAPVAPVVPVPPPKSLTKTPEDVSAEPMTMTASDVFALSAEKPANPEFTAPVATESVKSVQVDEEGGPEVSVSKKPAKKTPRKTRVKKAVAVELSDDQIERLRKMAPGSVKKLVNTLSTQFKFDAAEAAVDALVKKGVLALDRDHVIWK